MIELKYNDSAESAIRQIREKHYPDALKGFGGEVLLVGVSYDAKTKRHTCVMETAEVE